MIVKKDTPVEIPNKQSLKQQPTNTTTTDSEPPSNEQPATSTLTPSNAAYSIDLDRVLSKGLSLVADVIGSVPVDDEISSCSSENTANHEERVNGQHGVEVSVACNRSFSIWKSKLDPQESGSFDSVESEKSWATTEEEKQQDEGLVVHENVVCDK